MSAPSYRYQFSLLSMRQASSCSIQHPPLSAILLHHGFYITKIVKNRCSLIRMHESTRHHKVFFVALCTLCATTRAPLISQKIQFLNDVAVIFHPGRVHTVSMVTQSTMLKRASNFFQRRRWQTCQNSSSNVVTTHRHYHQKGSI